MNASIEFTPAAEARMAQKKAARVERKSRQRPSVVVRKKNRKMALACDFERYLERRRRVRLSAAMAVAEEGNCTMQAATSTVTAVATEERLPQRAYAEFAPDGVYVHSANDCHFSSNNYSYGGYVDEDAYEVEDDEIAAIMAEETQLFGDGGQVPPCPAPEIPWEDLLADGVAPAAQEVTIARMGRGWTQPAA